MNGMNAVDRPVEHWSLHQSDNQFSLLVQMSPTQAFDGVLKFECMEKAAAIMHRLLDFHGRHLAAPLRISEEWFASTWENTPDGVRIEKVSTLDKLGDDVMLLVVADLLAVR